MSAPRDDSDVQADRNMILETLLKANELVDHCYVEHGSNRGLVIDFALDALKRLRNDARLVRDASGLNADARARDLDMVRRMARFGPGPGTTPEQTLNTIAVWAENKLHKLGAWPPGPADRAPKPQPDGGRTHG